MLAASRIAFVLLATSLLAPPALLQGKGAPKPAEPAPQGKVEKLDDLGLAITLPDAFGETKPIAKKGQVKAGWTGKLGESEFAIRLYVLPNAEFGFDEPEDVNDLVLQDYRKQGDATFAYAKTELVTGAFGYAPYASLGYGPIHGKDGQEIVGSYYVLGGLLPKDGYSLEITCEPALDAAGEKVALEFLHKCVAYKGATRNAQWTDDEVKARWASDAPPDVVKKMEKPLRTKHYVFMSNTGAVKKMGEAMETSYAAIQKMYPFPEVAGRRLMPVFLFQQEEQYFAFFAKEFKATIEEARATKGVASQDFYATFYDAPQDPVHIHEMTHQIFRNRLRLGGAGSWFQEGVAEYICSRASDRVDAANLVKKERHMKTVEFVKIPSLISASKGDKTGKTDADSQYSHAALLIEFLRESKWSKDKFLDWVHAVGDCPDNNVTAIERATHDVLGVNLAELDLKFVEYCKARK